MCHALLHMPHEQAGLGHGSCQSKALTQLLDRLRCQLSMCTLGSPAGRSSALAWCQMCTCSLRRLPHPPPLPPHQPGRLAVPTAGDRLRAQLTSHLMVPPWLAHCPARYMSAPEDQADSCSTGTMGCLRRMPHCAASIGRDLLPCWTAVTAAASASADSLWSASRPAAL